MADAAPPPATHEPNSDLFATLRRSWHYLVLLALAIWLIFAVRGILGPFLIGLVAGYVLDPWLDRLQSRGWSRTRAVGLVFGVALLVAAVLAIVLVPVVVYQAQSVAETSRRTFTRLESWVATMPGMAAMEPLSPTDAAGGAQSDQPQPGEPAVAPGPAARVPSSESSSALASAAERGAEKTAQHQKLREAWEQWYDSNLPGWVPAKVRKLLPAPDLQDPAQGLAKYRGRLAQWGQQVAGRVGAAVWGSIGRLFFYIFTPFVTYYFLRDYDAIRHRVQSWVPERYRGRAEAAGAGMNRMLASYFRGQLLLMFLVFCTCFVAMSLVGLILGVDHALLVAAVDGLFYAVPVLGAWIASITAAVVGYVSADGNPWVAALVMLGLIQVINGIFDNAISPKIAGEKVGLHPLVVIFSVLAGSMLLGVVGMLVAVPVAASIKIGITTFMPEVFRPLQREAEPAPGGPAES